MPRFANEMAYIIEISRLGAAENERLSCLFWEMREVSCSDCPLYSESDFVQPPAPHHDRL
jgi:hypothetical protein